MIKVQTVVGDCWECGFVDGVWQGGTDEWSGITSLSLLSFCYELAKSQELAEGERRGITWEEYNEEDLHCPRNPLDKDSPSKYDVWSDLKYSGEDVDYAEFTSLFQGVKPMATVEFLID